MAGPDLDGVLAARLRRTLAAVAAASEGLDAGDRVANLYPLAGFPTGAFLSVVRSGMVVGFSVAHGLTGAANSEFKVRNSLSEAGACRASSDASSTRRGGAAPICPTCSVS